MLKHDLVTGEATPDPARLRRGFDSMAHRNIGRAHGQPTQSVGSAPFAPPAPSPEPSTGTPKPGDRPPPGRAFF